MSDEPIYNPLDKNHLAESIVREFFKRQLHRCWDLRPLLRRSIPSLSRHLGVAEGLSRYGKRAEETGADPHLYR